MGAAAKPAIPIMQSKANDPPPETTGLAPVQSVRDVALEAIDRIDQRHWKAFAPPPNTRFVIKEFDTPPDLHEEQVWPGRGKAAEGP
jgi:hypothetical protein